MTVQLLTPETMDYSWMTRRELAAMAVSLRDWTRLVEAFLARCVSESEAAFAAGLIDLAVSWSRQADGVAARLDSMRLSMLRIGNAIAAAE